MANSTRYQPVPSSDPDAALGRGPSTADRSAQTEQDPNRPLRASVQREFDRPPPATWKRLLLVLAIVAMAWFSYRLARPAKPKVIYAQRYSEEFKYRPAASPIITETLKDGRIRIRGAGLGSHGVREEDIPRSPAQIAHEKKERVEEARKRAREKVREGRRKGKGGAKGEV